MFSVLLPLISRSSSPTWEGRAERGGEEGGKRGKGGEGRMREEEVGK